MSRKVETLEINERKNSNFKDVFKDDKYLFDSRRSVLNLGYSISKHFLDHKNVNFFLSLYYISYISYLVKNYNNVRLTEVSDMILSDDDFLLN